MNKLPRLSTCLLAFGLIPAFCCYIILAVIHICADPHAIAFAEHDQWYDIPRNINIIQHIASSWSYFSFLDTAYYKHPPLFFYLGAVGYRLGGDMGLLLSMSLLSIGAVIAVYFLMQELYGRDTAISTALLLSYSPLFFGASFHVMFDNGTLLFFATASLLLYKGIVKDSWKQMFVGGLIAGLMLLYKTVLGLLYVGLAVFIILHFGKKNNPGKNFLSARSKLLGAFLISCIIYLPWNYYEKINGGGYPWLMEFFYKLSWQEGATIPPWYFYIREAPARLGWTVCGFVVIGAACFTYNLWKFKRTPDIFFFCVSGIMFLFYSLWTIKSFRFLVPIWPFFMYLIWLGMGQVSSWLIKALPQMGQRREWTEWGLVVLMIAGMFGRNIFVFSNIPAESPYKMAADYIKQNGLVSDCYLSDERIIFQNYMQKCVFWSQEDLNCNVAGIIGHNAKIAVARPSHQKYLPEIELIKIFTANNKEVGVYRIIPRDIMRIKNEHHPVVVKISDKSGRPIKGAFVWLFLANNNLIFEGRSGRSGDVDLLTFDEKFLTMRVEAWGKTPVVNLIPEELNEIRVTLQDGPFLKNGISLSQF